MTGYCTNHAVVTNMAVNDVAVNGMAVNYVAVIEFFRLELERGLK
jgi:hypothetical protein